jgi:hypothetical protein
LDTIIGRELLERWPTLKQLPRAHPGTLRNLFREHNCGGAFEDEMLHSQTTKLILYEGNQFLVHLGHLCGRFRQCDGHFYAQRIFLNRHYMKQRQLRSEAAGEHVYTWFSITAASAS